MNASDQSSEIDFRGNLIIHIGMHKTGSTSIQHVLDTNHEHLRDQNVLYPKAGRCVDNGRLMPMHHPLVWSLMGQGDRPISAHIESLRKEIEYAAPSKVILSSEHLSGFSLSSQVFRDIKRMFPNAKRTWIIYLRRQDHLALSRYAENVKTGKIAWPDGLWRELLAPSLNFRIVLERLHYAVGDDAIIPVSFDARKADLITSFCEACGINTPDGSLNRTRENTALAKGTLRTLRMVNAIPGSPGRFARRVVFSLNRLISGTRFRWVLDWPEPLSPKEKADLLKKHEDTNRWVETTYWNDQKFLTDTDAYTFRSD
ncbi:MAG: hypothetical protein ACQEUH_05440 [Pseudomonadota bacterium]